MMTSSFIDSSHGQRKGQAMVEFVLILPLLIVLCLAFFDVALILFTRVSVDRALHSAVNEACHLGPQAIQGKQFLPLVQKRLIGVVLKESDLSISVKPAEFEGVSELTITAAFSRKTISMMYFLKKANFCQNLQLTRLLPTMVVAQSGTPDKSVDDNKSRSLDSSNIIDQPNVLDKSNIIDQPNVVDKSNTVDKSDGGKQ